MFREQVFLKKDNKNLILKDDNKYKNKINISNKYYSLTRNLSNIIKNIEITNQNKVREYNKKNLYNSLYQSIDNNKLFQPNNYQSCNNIQLKIDHIKTTLTPPKNVYKSAAEIELKYELMLMEKDKIINKLKEELEYYKKLLQNSNNNNNKDQKLIDYLYTPQKNDCIDNKSLTIDNEDFKKNQKIYSERLKNFYSPKANDMLANFFINQKANSNLKKNLTKHRKVPSNSITTTFESNSAISNHKKLNYSPIQKKDNSKKISLIIEPNNLFNGKKESKDYQNKLQNITFKVTKLIDNLFKYVK